jgi:hypothetical protein
MIKARIIKHNSVTISKSSISTKLIQAVTLIRQNDFNKTNRLKEKIGVEPGIMDFIPEMPKGMNRTTFNNIIHEIQRLEYFGDLAMFEK